VTTDVIPILRVSDAERSVRWYEFVQVSENGG